MKKLLLLSCLACGAFYNAFPQCPFNLDFEQGTTAGWVCKSGTYGTGPCPSSLEFSDTYYPCPAFNTIDTTIGCINANGIDASLSTSVDRHVIVDNNYYGTGTDPNSVSPYLIHVVGSGKYSFRLGDDVEDPSCLNQRCYARSEAIRITFQVSPQNTLFTYRYAAFLQDAGHWPDEQPAFETFITKPDSGDKLIPNGYYKVVAGSYNVNCNGTNYYHAGVGQWKYSDWTDVPVDLSSYIGEKIAIEFRTHDCYPGTGYPIVTCNGNCCTTVMNGDTCIDSTKCTGGPPWCWGTHVCTNQAGNHSAYVYIDASCSPLGGLELSSDKILKIYPNPAINSFTVELSTQIKDAELNIYDMLGRLQLQKHLTTNKTEIQRGALESGAYFARVKIGEWQYVKKLVIE